MVAGNGGYGDLGTIIEITPKTVRVRWDFGATSTEYRSAITGVEEYCN